MHLKVFNWEVIYLNDKKIMVHFTILTFSIAYLVSGALIVLGHYGYTVHNWVNTPQEFAMNIPFSIYILSPAIASYLVLKKNNKVHGLKEWLGTVFYIKNKISLYLFVITGLTIYFSIHFIVAGQKELAAPFYIFFLSLPGNLIIGGLEESGWMYVLQPGLAKKMGYLKSVLLMGAIWTIWHIPLFFIPGTNHSSGSINFLMFTIQLLAFRFFHGTINEIGGKGTVFLCVLFHTMFNAASPLFGTMTMNWTGTIIANAGLIVFAVVTVMIYDKRKRNPVAP